MNNVLIAKCLYCGKTNCKGHNKYFDRCDDCGKRYAKYANYKWLQKHEFTMSRQARLEDIMEEYKALQRQGYKVPKDLP